MQETKEELKRKLKTAIEYCGEIDEDGPPISNSDDSYWAQEKTAKDFL